MCLHRTSHIFEQIMLLVFSLLSHFLIVMFHQNIISSYITPKILAEKKKTITKTNYHCIWFAGRQSIIQDSV